MASVCLSDILIFLQLVHMVIANEVLQTVHGKVGAENYTYYRMSRPGHLLIELESEVGDADLFVSAENLNPTFESYDIQSITCGRDFVEIPENFERPFGIGIYGHFTAELSSYKVTVYSLETTTELDYDQLTHYYYDYDAADHLFYNFEASDYMFRDVKSPPRQMQGSSDTQGGYSGTQDLDQEDTDVGSVLWQVLLTLLKVVFEVIL